MAKEKEYLGLSWDEPGGHSFGAYGHLGFALTEKGLTGVTVCFSGHANDNLEKQTFVGVISYHVKI